MLARTREYVRSTRSLLQVARGACPAEPVDARFENPFCSARHLLAHVRWLGPGSASTESLLRNAGILLDSPENPSPDHDLPGLNYREPLRCLVDWLKFHCGIGPPPAVRHQPHVAPSEVAPQRRASCMPGIDLPESWKDLPDWVSPPSDWCDCWQRTDEVSLAVFALVAPAIASNAIVP